MRAIRPFKLIFALTGRAWWLVAKSSSASAMRLAGSVGALVRHTEPDGPKPTRRSADSDSD